MPAEGRLLDPSEKVAQPAGHDGRLQEREPISGEEDDGPHEDDGASRGDDQVQKHAPHRGDILQVRIATDETGGREDEPGVPDNGEGPRRHVDPETTDKGNPKQGGDGLGQRNHRDTARPYVPDARERPVSGQGEKADDVCADGSHAD